MQLRLGTVFLWGDGDNEDDDAVNSLLRTEGDNLRGVWGCGRCLVVELPRVGVEAGVVVLVVVQGVPPPPSWDHLPPLQLYSCLLLLLVRLWPGVTGVPLPFIVCIAGRQWFLVYER